MAQQQVLPDSRVRRFFQPLEERLPDVAELQLAMKPEQQTLVSPLEAQPLAWRPPAGALPDAAQPEERRRLLSAA